MSRLQVILSARDPGAAQCIVPVVREAAKYEEISAVLVAQDPAAGYFERAGLPVLRVVSPALRDTSDPRAAELLGEADRILDQAQPDVLVTGLSSPGVGIDEALLHRSRALFKYSIQDSDGTVIRGFGTPAATYFVASEWAARGTRRYPEVLPIVVGSLSHAEYARLDPTALRAAGRRSLSHAGDSPVVGFYGQPLWGLRGYRRTIERLAEAVGESLPSALMIYRPHPKESPEERTTTMRTFSSRRLATALDPNPGIETSLCVPDVVATCFSACGNDHMYLQRQSKSPLGSVLYLLFEPDVAGAFSDDGGAGAPWAAASGVALMADSHHSLKSMIQAAAAPDTAAKSWERAQLTVKPVSDAPAQVIRHILNDTLGHSRRTT